MRHIDLNLLLGQVFAGADGEKTRLQLRHAHIKAASSTEAREVVYIKSNGRRKWKVLKDRATSVLGSKCWYTEVELTGAPLVVDHYRPVCHYWWLAYDPENYRIACPWANSPKQNPLYGCAGGKGDKFPLLPPRVVARGKRGLRVEKPVLLDPCRAGDCELLAFEADGRPILNPLFANDPVALNRVEESKILLNLDHPAFNSKREQLNQQIDQDVQSYEQLPTHSAQRAVIRSSIEGKLAPNAEFSMAARFYLRQYRHLEWVQAILDQQ